METFIDNTGLHSTGRCLQGNALGLIDIKGLLQLGTQLVFSERILVSGFEYERIKQRSSSIRRTLRGLGVPPETLLIRSFRAYKYAMACREAALSFADEFEYVFPPAVYPMLNLEATRPDFYPDELRFKEDMRALILDDSSDHDLRRAADPALVGRARSSIPYMLATCPVLLQKVRDFARSKGWSEGRTWELVCMLRYYVNQELAQIRHCLYTPAVARAQIVRECNDLLIQRLSSIATEAAHTLQPRSLSIPGVAGALLIRSKGDARGVVHEALSLRHRASELRAYLAKRLREIEPDSASWHHELNVEINKLARALREELHPESRPHLTHAIQLHIGLPFLSFQLAEVSRWREFLKLRKHISVLTEISKTLAYDNTERIALHRLVRSCVRKRETGQSEAN